jgi:hypothetical protein
MNTLPLGYGVRRSHRKICWTNSSLFAAAALGCLVGVALAATLYAHRCAPSLERVSCVIREPSDGMQRTAAGPFTTLTGYCRTGG